MLIKRFIELRMEKESGIDFPTLQKMLFQILKKPRQFIGLPLRSMFYITYTFSEKEAPKKRLNFTLFQFHRHSTVFF